jgi:hypothetical protein
MNTGIWPNPNAIMGSVESIEAKKAIVSATEAAREKREVNERCPFCGSGNLGVMTNLIGWSWIYCLSCHGPGPVARVIFDPDIGQAKAWQLWRTRMVDHNVVDPCHE